MEQLRRKIDALDVRQDNLLPLMRQTVIDWAPSTRPEEIGTVLTVGDDIATISGLQDATYGEVLDFANGIRGMVQELRPDELCCVLFGDSSSIEAGDPVRRTGKVAGMPVGEAFLGRVVDALASPSTAVSPSRLTPTTPSSARPPASSTASPSTNPWRPACWPSTLCSPSAAASVN